MKKLFILFSLLLFIKEEITAQQDSIELLEESKIKAKRQLQLIRDRIMKGENFNTLAILYSEDPGSARYGGCYERIKQGTFVTEFENVVLKLKINELSDVFETAYGYHIVLLKAKHGDEMDVCHILIKPK